MPLPIRGRIAVFASIVVCAVIVALGVAVYVVAERQTYSRLDDGLAAHGRQAATLYEHAGISPAPGASSDADFTVIAHPGVSPPHAPVIPGDVLRTADRNGAAWATLDRRRGARVRVWVTPVGSGAYLVAGQSLQPVEAQVNGVLTLSFLIAGLVMAAGVAAIWIVAGLALRPLRQVAATAERVGLTQDLSLRLPAPEVDDEVGRVAESFNRMLSRLEGAMESQRRFVADASHELRSPLTSISANAGLLLRTPTLSAADRRAALEDIEEESARLARLVDGLLALARADAGQPDGGGGGRAAPIVDLAESAGQAVAKARRLSATPELVLAADRALARADPDSVARVLSNLLDNALRHARARVTVTVGGGPGWSRVEVTDDGPGIPAGERELVFERFHQGGSSRGPEGGGAGLGLAIARLLVTGMGGRIGAFEGPGGGALLRVELPAAEPAG